MSSFTHEQLKACVAAYEMPAAAVKLLQNHQPLILCGITAAGKNTLAHELIAGGGYEAVISHTTRAARENHGVLEKDGINYHFTSEPEMLELIAAKQFVETKLVHGKVYGTSIEALAEPFERGNIPVLDIDVQGTEEFVTAVPILRPIFLLPPSFLVWRQRLAGRGAMDSRELEQRMKSAVMEIETIMLNPAFQLLINTDKTQTAEMVHSGHIGRGHDAVAIADHLVEEIKEKLASHASTLDT